VQKCTRTWHKWAENYSLEKKAAKKLKKCE